MAILKKVEEAGVTLNENKCDFSKSAVKFLDQILDRFGVKPDLNI